ncbi:MAG: hypothetical protein KAX49_14270 [Halanaerobiales bacterium]|nr:hypothetical protein [Halanaerobiales bacterium]
MAVSDDRKFDGSNLDTEDFETPFDDEPAESTIESVDGCCYACDGYGTLNSLGLCEVCSAKLERDMIRQRDWAYSMTAFAMNDKQRENLRKKVIKKYGKKLELIAK